MYAPLDSASTSGDKYHPNLTKLLSDQTYSTFGFESLICFAQNMP